MIFQEKEYKKLSLLYNFDVLYTYIPISTKNCLKNSITINLCHEIENIMNVS